MPWILTGVRFWFFTMHFDPSMFDINKIDMYDLRLRTKTRLRNAFVVRALVELFRRVAFVILVVIYSDYVCTVYYVVYVVIEYRYLTF